MKKLGILACLVFGVLLTLEAQVMAGEPNTTSSSRVEQPSGKNTTYSRMVFHNSSNIDCRVWIRPKGTPLPHTVRELDRIMISVSAHRQNRRTGRLKFGDYVCTTFYASDIQGFIDQDLDQGLFDLGKRDEINIGLHRPEFQDVYIQNDGILSLIGSLLFD